MANKPILLIQVLLAVTFSVALSEQGLESVKNVCSIDAQCKPLCKGHANAECIRNICFCSGMKEGMALSAEEEEEVKGLKDVGNTCNVDAQCKPLCKGSAYAQCTGHKCFCSGMQEGSELPEREEGLKAAEKTCNLDAQCKPLCKGSAYAQCIGHKCFCSGREEVMALSGAEEGSKTMGYTCNLDAQCKPLCKGSAYAECIGHKCFCSSMKDGKFL